MARLLIGFVIGLIVVPAVAAVVVFGGRFPFQATAKPPGWERQIANMALDPAVDARAEGLTNPLSATDEDLMKGMKIYRDDCAMCHGHPGKASTWGRNNFYPPAPQLAERGVHDPVPHIYVVVKYGIRYTGMGGWKDELPEEDLWRVSMFLHQVKTLPPAVAAAWNAPGGVAPGDSASAGAH